jgi:prepilin-type N-terminal cleavage/methylation domain-containing protein
VPRFAPAAKKLTSHRRGLRIVNAVVIGAKPVVNISDEDYRDFNLPVMKTLPSRVALQRAAFTLIEILTVLAIISILMGILMPVLVKIRDIGRSSSARNDTRQIIAAVSGYVADYGKLPSVMSDFSRPSTGGADTIVGSALVSAKLPNSALFNTLRAIAEEPNIDHKLNPRRTIYFTTRSVSDPDHPRGGFLDRTESKSGGLKGCLYDPWGTQYNVILDTNGDNVLDVNQVYSDFNDAEKPRGIPAGAFSLGIDQKVGTNGDGRFRKGADASDDLVSWR